MQTLLVDGCVGWGNGPVPRGDLLGFGRQLRGLRATVPARYAVGVTITPAFAFTKPGPTEAILDVCKAEGVSFWIVVVSSDVLDGATGGNAGIWGGYFQTWAASEDGSMTPAALAMLKTWVPHAFSYPACSVVWLGTSWALFKWPGYSFGPDGGTNDSSSGTPLPEFAEICATLP